MFKVFFRQIFFFLDAGVDTCNKRDFLFLVQASLWDFSINSLYYLFGKCGHFGFINHGKLHTGFDGDHDITVYHILLDFQNVKGSALPAILIISVCCSDSELFQ